MKNILSFSEFQILEGIANISGLANSVGLGDHLSNVTSLQAANKQRQELMNKMQELKDLKSSKAEPARVRRVQAEIELLKTKMKDTVLTAKMTSMLSSLAPKAKNLPFVGDKIGKAYKDKHDVNKEREEINQQREEKKKKMQPILVRKKFIEQLKQKQQENIKRNKEIEKVQKAKGQEKEQLFDKYSNTQKKKDYISFKQTKEAFKRREEVKEKLKDRRLQIMKKQNAERNKDTNGNLRSNFYKNAL